MPDDHPTVYSTLSGRICPRCGKPVANCVCKTKKQKIDSGDGVVRIFRESKGRKGKTVTLIKGLAMSESDLRKLLTDLKRTCGSGGSIKENILEIQGDHRETILAVLKKKGYNPSISGG